MIDIQPFHEPLKDVLMENCLYSLEDEILILTGRSVDFA